MQESEDRHAGTGYHREPVCGQPERNRVGMVEPILEPHGPPPQSSARMTRAPHYTDLYNCRNTGQQGQTLQAHRGQQTDKVRCIQRIVEKCLGARRRLSPVAQSDERVTLAEAAQFATDAGALSAAPGEHFRLSVRYTSTALEELKLKVTLERFLEEHPEQGIPPDDPGIAERVAAHHLEKAQAEADRVGSGGTGQVQGTPKLFAAFASALVHWVKGEDDKAAERMAPLLRSEALLSEPRTALAMVIRVFARELSPFRGLVAADAVRIFADALSLGPPPGPGVD